MICPLCKQEGADRQGQLQGRDAYIYSCPRCGRFGLDQMAAFDLQAGVVKDQFRLSAATRAASDRGEVLTLETDNLSAIASATPSRPALMEAVDRVMLFLASRTPEYWASARFNKETDYPLVFCKNAEEMNFLLVTAAELGLFDVQRTKITVPGWRHIDSIRTALPDSRQAFVAMWFDSQMDEVWKHGFRPAIEVDNYFRAVRIDGVHHNGKIDDRIVAEIRRSGLVVADFTGDRGGVYYEAGYAGGLAIPVIWTVRADWVAKLHFDTRQYNHIVWETTKELNEKLSERIRATVLPPSGKRPS